MDGKAGTGLDDAREREMKSKAWKKAGHVGEMFKTPWLARRE